MFGRAIGARGALKLDRGMLDPEAFVQFMRDRLEQLVIQLWLALHDMGGAGRLGRAQAPNMEVMDLGDAGKLLEEILHRAWIDSARDGVEHKIDRIAPVSYTHLTLPTS